MGITKPSSRVSNRRVWRLQVTMRAHRCATATRAITKGPRTKGMKGSCPNWTGEKGCNHLISCSAALSFCSVCPSHLLSLLMHPILFMPFTDPTLRFINSRWTSLTKAHLLRQQSWSTRSFEIQCKRLRRMVCAVWPQRPPSQTGDQLNPTWDQCKTWTIY